MLRGAYRPYIVGIIVFTFSFVLLSIVFRQTEHRPSEQSYSSRQRGPIVVGAVREAPAPAAAAVPASNEEATPVAAIEAEPSSSASAAKPVAEKPRAYVPRTRAHASSPRNTARVVEREPVTPAPIVATQAEPVAPAPTLPVETPQRPEAPKSVTEERPLPTAPVAAVPTSGNSAPSASAPKTRQQVEDELRRARSSGALPKFGNPNPYGPGGSPSYTTAP